MTTTQSNQPINRRYDFVLLFDVVDGNPNGDPDAGNLPRIDPQTMQGLVTDGCLKRKIRNAIAVLANGRTNCEIYFQTQDAAYEKRILNMQHQRAHDALESRGQWRSDDKAKDKAENTRNARQWMCENFYDIRAFGAVMTTGVNCGQVRGPVQITFARSVDPIVPMELSITRKSVTTEEEAAKQAKADGSVTGTMGRKNTVPYGLYRGHGFVNPYLAADTGFTGDDLELLWHSLRGLMWEIDRSASRGLMATRGLYVFEHASPLGNAPAHELFDRVSIRSFSADPESAVPRSFDDYRSRLSISDAPLPPGVTLHRMIG